MSAYGAIRVVSTVTPQLADLVEKVGTMRLHPITDGLIPEPAERGVKSYDRSGNRLRDVIDQTTGFCTGVTSPLTIPDGKSVLDHTPVSGNGGPDFRYDDESARYYDLVRSSESAPTGLVIRLTTDGDDLLPVSRVVIVQCAPSKTGAPERKSSAPVQKSASTRSANDAAVKAVLDSMGYKGKIDRVMRKAVLDMIEIEKNLSGVDEGIASHLRKRMVSPNLPQ